MITNRSRRRFFLQAPRKACGARLPDCKEFRDLVLAWKFSMGRSRRHRACAAVNCSHAKVNAQRFCPRLRSRIKDCHFEYYRKKLNPSVVVLLFVWQNPHNPIERDFDYFCRKPTTPSSSFLFFWKNRPDRPLPDRPESRLRWNPAGRAGQKHARPKASRVGHGS